MTGKTTISIDGALGGTRLDMLLLGRHPEFSRTAIQRFIAAGAATVNGEPGKPGLRLEPDDIVEYALPEPDTEASTPQPEEMKLEILHEDGDVLVLNKPAGIAVHPGAGSETGTLVAGLLFREPEAFALVGEDPGRPGIVHRLDKDTSGVLVVARTAQAHAALKKSFQECAVDKIYLAIARGHFKEPSGAIEAPIGRDPKNRQRFAVLATGKEALTKYRVVAEEKGMSLLQVRLYTGRTHQIRVHLSHIGHPVLGDRLYGGPSNSPPFHAHRQMLHAWKIAFPHPSTGERMVFTAPTPDDFRNNLEPFAEHTDLTGLAQ